MAEGQKITKTFDAEVSVDEGKREVLAVISSSAIDREGEVVSPKGMKKKNYAGNPVVMVNHDYKTLPIGKALWVKADSDKILAKYRVSDKTQLARDVFALIQDGVLRAHSIGFISNHASKPTTKEINERPELKDAKLIHRDWELFEFSVVGIPCNPEALTLAVSKGLSSELLEFLTAKAKQPEIVAAKPEEGIVKPSMETGIQDARARIAGAVIHAAKTLPSRVDIDKAVAVALKRFTS